MFDSFLKKKKQKKTNVFDGLSNLNQKFLKIHFLISNNTVEIMYFS